MITLFAKGYCGRKVCLQNDRFFSLLNEKIMNSDHDLKIQLLYKNIICCSNKISFELYFLCFNFMDSIFNKA